MIGFKFKITEQGRKISVMKYEYFRILERVLDYTKPGLDERLYYHYKLILEASGDIFSMSEDEIEEEFACGCYEIAD